LIYNASCRTIKRVVIGARDTDGPYEVKYSSVSVQAVKAFGELPQCLPLPRFGRHRYKSSPDRY
jgi:hypothetical protein